MDIFAFVPVIAFLCFLSYQAGQYSKQSPSEEDMLQRIITMRAARKINQITIKDLDAEIEKASDNLVKNV